MSNNREANAAANARARVELAEILATGVALRRAREQLGMNGQRATALWRSVRDDMAEAVSEHGLVRAAGAALGLSSRAAQWVWETIERDTDLGVERPEGRVRG